MPGGPVDIKILLDKGRPVTVHALCKLNCFVLRLPVSLQPAHFFFEWRIDENMERVRTIT